jgi:xylan 1,4-beta-xylosidase
MRLLALLLAAAPLPAQDVTIRVDAAKHLGAFRPIYRYFGYDEPNFTYTQNGKELVDELGRLPGPVYLRTHFLLASGNAQAGFKFGSTNVYTEDAGGKPVYDWAVVDRIFDTYLHTGAKPFVEIGFMPQALSSKPEPYTPHWAPGETFNQYYLGWTYPPSDYAKWSALIEAWVKHEVQRVGAPEVASWYWELWNEPDIAYWHGTPDEYNKLYDVTAAAVKRVLPSAKVGGPATTGPASVKAAAYLRQFLEHCDKTGVPLDFITFHAKGRPEFVDSHVRMGIAKNAQDVEKGFQMVREFPKFRNLPIILSESDPDGCAACSARVYPQNAYRNGPLYASYAAGMLKNILDLADREQVNIEGMLTWAFEFEDQPSFDGFRTLATNGVPKPILNLFHMLAQMYGERIETVSSARIPLAAMVKDGVRAAPDVDAMAVRNDQVTSVLLWNYHDDDLPAPDARVKLQLSGLKNGPASVLHFRIDETHSNAWTAWKKMGSPPHPTAIQTTDLWWASRLQQLKPATQIVIKNGAADLEIALPRQGVSLIHVYSH